MLKGISESIFGKKTNINEKLLQENNINIIKKSEININRNSELTVTLTGRIYQGKYKNKSCSIKILEKLGDEIKINELILWHTMFKSDNILLNFKGACISGPELYLIFEHFNFTLDKALSMNIVKDSLRLKITIQIFNILEKLQNKKKIHMNLTPMSFGFLENGDVKLIDFGSILITEGTNKELLNLKVVEKSLIKYLPPEKINFLTEDISSDIWSFGCVLIDLYSVKEPVFKINIKIDELRAMHDVAAFPIIPDDISGLLRDIITNCLEVSFVKRIKIQQLKDSMTIYINNLKEILSYEPDNANLNLNSNNNINKDTIENEYSSKIHSSSSSSVSINNKKINTNDDFIYNDYNYIKAKEITLSLANVKITDELMTNAVNSKHKIDDTFMNSENLKNEKANIIYNEIKQFNTNTSIVLKILKNKIIDKIIKIQETIAIASSEIFQMQGVLNEMKANVMSIINLSNPKSFVNLINSIDNSRVSIQKHISKYTNLVEYDKLIELNDELNYLVVEFKIYAFNEVHMLDNIIESIKEHSKLIVNSTNLVDLSVHLELEERINKVFNLTKINNCDVDFSIENIWAKAQEDSSMIAIYDTINKTIYQEFLINKDSKYNSSYKMLNSKVNNAINDYKIFKPKCSCLFKKSDKTIYSTGGIIKNNNLKEFVKVEIYFDNSVISYNICASNNTLQDVLKINNQDNPTRNNNVKFKNNNLPELIVPRSHHSSIWNLEEDILIVVGGSNTKTCEAYSVDNNKWFLISDLPNYAPNSSLCIVQNNLFCFNAGAEYSSFCGIYYLSLLNFKNIYSISSDIKGIIPNEWQNVTYEFNFNGRIKKNMCAVPYKSKDFTSIYLFGGFDPDRSFYEVMEFTIDVHNNYVNKVNLEKENSFINKYDKNNSNENNNEINDYNDNCLTLNNNNEYSEMSNNINNENDSNNNIISNISNKQNNITNEDKEDTLNINKFVFNKLPYELPIATYFNSNYLLVDNSLIMICGQLNVIEFDLLTKDFYYYT